MSVEADEVPLYASAKRIFPQAVSGPYRRLKWRLLAVCLTIYYLLPFVRWDRGPNLPDQAVLLDLEKHRFYFFFIEIWPQEVYYFTGLLIMAALMLFLMNALAGRVWCGYLCPQTVWTDLFLAVERWIDGDRRAQVKLHEAPWSLDKLRRRVAKHAIWLLIAWWTGGAWVLYFADAPTLVVQLATFEAPWVAYVWIGILTFTTYTLAGHMREQVCTYMCPWPRIQAALTDDEALNVTYRYDRGEPRMSLKSAVRRRAEGQTAGDCVDCNQCVAVCPTGVDIREGSQLGCIQCGLCIDACNTVMARIERPLGLIEYDTDANVKARQLGQPTRVRLVRPRTIAYAAIIAVVGGLMLGQLATRSTAGLNVQHDRNPLFVKLKEGGIRNAYTLRILNKRPETRPFALSAHGVPGIEIEAVGVAPTADWRPVVEVEPDSTREVRVFITVPATVAVKAKQDITIVASDLFAGEVIATRDHFFAP
jgi:cytochrome c oxidase accessory protein FixG